MMNKEQRIQAVAEVEALKSLNNPFIVRYRESFMHNKRYLCIVMSYCRGGNLMETILKQKKLRKHFS